MFLMDAKFIKISGLLKVISAGCLISEKCCPVTELFWAKGSTEKLGMVKALIVLMVLR